MYNTYVPTVESWTKEILSKICPGGHIDESITTYVDSDGNLDFSFWNRYMGDYGFKITNDIIKQIEEKTGQTYSHCMVRKHVTAFVFRKNK